LVYAIEVLPTIGFVIGTALNWLGIVLVMLLNIFDDFTRGPTLEVYLVGYSVFAAISAIVFSTFFCFVSAQNNHKKKHRESLWFG
jgi:hypothetical protein